MNVINYYKEKKNNLYHKLLNFAEENNESLDWNNRHQLKYKIFLMSNKKDLDYYINYNEKTLGTVYFSSRKLIQEVIDKYNDESIEYFKHNKRIDYHNKLLNEISKFAEENNKHLDWNNENQKKYCIYYNYNYKKIKISYVSICQEFGTIFFSSKRLAQKAIDKYQDELISYFEEHRYEFN